MSIATVKKLAQAAEDAEMNGNGFQVAEAYCALQNALPATLLLQLIDDYQEFVVTAKRWSQAHTYAKQEYAELLSRAEKLQ